MHLLGWILHFAVTAVSVLIVAKLMPGMRAKSFGSAFWFAIVLALFNVIAWKVLVLATLPFAVLTAGIGYFIVNGVVFLLAARVTDAVQVSGCFTATFAAVGVSVVNWGLDRVLHVR